MAYKHSSEKLGLCIARLGNDRYALAADLSYPRSRAGKACRAHSRAPGDKVGSALSAHPPKIFFHIRVEKVSGAAYNPTAKYRQKFTGVIPVVGQVNFGPFFPAC